MRVMRRRFWPRAAVAAILPLAALLASPLQAGRLDAETCKRLEEERKDLVQQGVQKNMAKGYQWAKANLTQDNLTLIRRFLEIQESLEFRCKVLTPGARFEEAEAFLKKAAETENAAETAEAGKEAAGPTPPLPVKKDGPVAQGGTQQLGAPAAKPKRVKESRQPAQ